MPKLKYILFFAGLLGFLIVNGQNNPPASGFKPDRSGKRKKAFVPESPEQQQKKQMEQDKKDEPPGKKKDGKVEPGEDQEKGISSRRMWKWYLRKKKDEVDDHHDRIQTKKTRKRMKKHKKDSKRINDHKKPPLHKRIFKGNGR